MGNKKEKNNLRVLNTRVHAFNIYNLNKFRNILAPVPCECGCGGNANPVFDCKEDLFAFGYCMLADCPIKRGAIFVHGLDGKMYAVVKLDENEYEYDYSQDYDPDENPISFLGINETDYDFFADIDADFFLDGYGLMVETIDSGWAIVTE